MYALQIKFTKDSAKQINALDSKTKKLYRILIKFIPEEQPLSDELEAIRKLDYAISNGELIDENEINWN